MNMTIFQTAALAAAALFVAQVISTGPAEASPWRRVGPYGTAGGFANSGQYGQSAGIGGWRNGVGGAGAAAANYAGPNGGTYQGAGGGAWRPGVGGFGGGAYKATGPNGGTAQGAGAGAWKNGVGGYENTSRQYSNPNGNNMNAYSNGKYNAQTGQGQLSSGKSGTYDGQKYGYTDNTQFTKGQGGDTTLDTTNHGDYNINYAPGQKPVVTQTP